MRHTPGPWKVSSPHNGVINAFLVDYGPVTANQIVMDAGANARLIAAAPEMLEQLERCLLNIESLNALIEERCPDLRSGSSDTEEMTRKVIAKAKGDAR